MEVKFTKNKYVSPKRLIKTFSGVNIGTDGAELIANGLQLSQGLELDNRIGRTIFLDKIVVSGIVYLTPGQKDNLHVRCMLVETNKTDATNSISSWFDFVAGDTGLRFHTRKNFAKYKRCNVLHDKLISLKSRHSFDIEIDGTTFTISNGDSVYYEMSHTFLHKKVIYNNNTSIPQNINLHLFAISDQNTTPLGIPPQSLLSTGIFEVQFRDAPKRSRKVKK